MRLLQRKRDGTTKFTQDYENDILPKYAILSHTWSTNNDEEVTYDDLMHEDSKVAESKLGYEKIRFCGDQAATEGLEYFWVDTCCINRHSSAELQQAITEMFSYYQRAVTCYVYLADVKAKEAPVIKANGGTTSVLWEAPLRESRWFKRGWTLQELLAPDSVHFFSADRIRLGDKRSLEHLIHEITGIPHQALRGRDLNSFSVTERLSWSKNRQTKKKEDRAYCLLGIFGIFMPLLYGEGDYAYARLSQEIEAKHSNSTRLDTALSTLPVALDAAFNSFNNQHESICLPDTRVELLQEIAEWVAGDDDSCVWWLNGIAGTGKSTIARTIARKHHDMGNLGASFFFSRGGGDHGSANKLVTTLARQLANRVPSAKRSICEAVVEHTDITEYSLRDQWDQLILKPLSKLDKNSSPPIILLVLDALDECDSERDIRALVQLLASARTLTNVRLRVFVTSRPEVPIRHIFGKIPDESTVFVLHEISPAIVNRDLTLFFENQFQSFKEERGLEDEWPGADLVKRLVDISCGLFIWASIACRFVCEGKQIAMRRIEALIKGHRRGGGPEEQLDQIYTTVLENAIVQDCSETEKAELYAMLNETLGAVVLLASPLSMESLANLLGRPLVDIKETMNDLHTIFHIPEQTYRPIRPHHPTFRDFLLDKNRCSDPNFWVDEKKMHGVLADRCLTLMEKKLKRDICGLDWPGKLQSDVDSEQIERCIPPALQYACLYWAQHYRRSGAIFFDNDRVDRFFREHFLHWLEAASLMGKSNEVAAIARLYHSLLDPSKNSRQIPFLKDARRLIFTFGSIIKQVPLQAYCAALAFIPPHNELKLGFQKQMHPWIKGIRIAEAIGDAKQDFFYVNELSFSPDGKLLAAGSLILAARLWDVTTRAAISKFEGPTDKVSTVAISPDGTLIAGGADDFTVWIWELKTGNVRFHLKAHASWVNSVFFIPNGKYLVSGSMDETVAFWDLSTGQEVKRFDNQSSPVNDATLSPDSSVIATGSNDRMVRLWNISKPKEDLVLMLDGHSGCVNCVRFSPDGRQIVSGSDDMTMRIWDAVKGAELKVFRGHTKTVWAVLFASNARLVVSGSEDMTVKVWDASNGALLQTLTAHSSGISTIAVSPNDRLLASCSFDDEVRLWDTRNWTLLGELECFKQKPGSPPATREEFKAHGSAVTNVVFSPNGQLVVSGSEDFMIKVWLKEAVERWRFEGHSGAINHLTFSRDSRLLASASADKTVRIWNIETGVAYSTLTGHSDAALFVVFSLDGKLLASFSADNTIIVWSLADQALVAKFEGSTDRLNDLSFSPDNRLIAFCSTNSTIVLWSMTEKATVASLRGHSGAVNSVSFSSDGKMLISCSDDGTVKLWNNAGETIGTLEGNKVQVNSAALSPDKKLLVACLVDGTVKLWDMERQVPLGVHKLDLVLQKVSFSSCGQCIETDRGILGVDYFFASNLSTSSDHKSLFVTREWVTLEQKNIIWLPEEYYPTSVATRYGVIVLGHSDGRISFISI
jgi:WD40 repeat protein